MLDWEVGSGNLLLFQLQFLPTQLGDLLASPPFMVHEILSWSSLGVTTPFGWLHCNYIVGLNQKVGEAHQLQ